MISVIKNNNEIAVSCSSNEVITIDKIKGIVKTIKKIDNKIDSPCNVSIKSFKEINFTLHGELFFKRILNSNLMVSPRLKIQF